MLHSFNSAKVPISIPALTPLQRSQLEDYRTKWLDIALCNSPSDRDMAEIGIYTAYESVRLKAPKEIIWADSPCSASKLATSMHYSQTNVIDKIRTILREKTSALLEHYLWSGVREEAVSSLRNPIYDQASTIFRHHISPAMTQDFCNTSEDFCLGQYDSHWLALFDFYSKVLKIDETEKMNGLGYVAQAAGPWWPMKDSVVISDRFKEIAMNNGQLHNPSGKAIEYADGWGTHALRGVRVPAYLIENPESITPAIINKENNQEIKRIMIEVFGFERYVLEGGGTLLSEDETGKLWMIKEYRDIHREHLFLVAVKNASKEPDGTYKSYLLRVPPWISSAKEGVAWTFGFDSELEAQARNWRMGRVLSAPTGAPLGTSNDYNPLQQS